METFTRKVKLNKIKKLSNLQTIDPLIIAKIRLCHYYNEETSILVTTSDEVYSVNLISTFGSDKGKLIDLKPVQTVKKIEELCGKSVSEIYSGHAFFIAKGGGNKFYGWGNNKHGQLGLDLTTEILVPTKIVELEDKNIRTISCGSEHALGLSNDGQVYGWGENRDGQVGNGGYPKQLVPCKVVLGDEPVGSIQSGADFSAALTKKGEIYTWGCNLYGQLGLAYRGRRSEPRKVKLEGIIQIACGYNHMLALTKHFRVFVWGSPNLKHVFSESGLNLDLLANKHCEIWPIPVEPHTQPTLEIFASFKSQISACKQENKISIWKTINDENSSLIETPHENFEDLAMAYKISGISIRVEDCQSSYEDLLEVLFDNEGIKNPLDFPDIHFKFGKNLIRVHKHILQKQSYYFRNFFDWKLISPSDAKRIVIEAGENIGAVSFLAFRAFLYYVYTDKVEVELTELDDICELYKLSHLLLEPTLQKECEVLLKARVTSVGNSLQIYETGRSMNGKELEVSATNFLKEYYANPVKM